jgi:hypothetical protein
MKRMVIILAISCFFPFTYANSQSVTAKYINGIAQADQFPGTDACQKLNNAMAGALAANAVAQVDATHFLGTQVCTTGNPFSGLATKGASINLVVNFGATHWQIPEPWEVDYSNVTLRGMGAWATQIEYTGAPGAGAVLFFNGFTNTVNKNFGLQGIQVEGIYLYGGASNVTNGLQLTFVNRSKITSVYAWGVTGCGILTQGAVTTTFIQPRVSSTDAALQGIQDSSHITPSNGLCLGGITGTTVGNIDTTSSTIIDAGMEYLTGIGIYIESADQVRIVGGTSEGNHQGIVILSSSAGVNPGTSNKYNRFDTIDLEGNTANTSGVDISSTGQQNIFENILSFSSCSGCNAVSLSHVAEEYLIGGFQFTGVTGQSNGISVFGFNATSATGGSATALPSQPAGYITEQFLGANVHVPYYH